MPLTGSGVDTGEMTVLGRINTASNITLVCDLVDPEVADSDTAPQRVVYKPVRGEQPLWDFPDGTLAGREVASYLISEALGWRLIPETVLRDGPFGPGMVQRWITISEDPDRPDLVDLCPPDEVAAGFCEVLRAVDQHGRDVSLVHADTARMQQMAVLDVLLNNADRKGGHAIESVDGHVYGVDHGICLHAEHKLRTVLWGWAGQPIPEHLCTDIAAFVDGMPGAPADQLSVHITDTEIDALLVRATRLLDDPVMPLPNTARPIPWPAF